MLCEKLLVLGFQDIILIGMRIAILAGYSNITKSDLLRRDGPGEVGDDPAEELVVGGEADEELQLVVLAQPRAGRLDASDELRIHS